MAALEKKTTLLMQKVANKSGSASAYDMNLWPPPATLSISGRDSGSLNVRLAIAGKTVSNMRGAVHMQLN
jgi:hypothetical protein